MHQDYKKLLVVDGKVAFTGGVNISGAYANSSLFRSKSRNAAKVGWRDTHIRVEGSVTKIFTRRTSSPLTPP